MLALNDRRATPCEAHDDGRDFVKTNKWIVFGHHFAAIAGPGPLVGPVLAALLHWQDWEHPFYVLVLYAVIVFVDGFVLQPYIMRRVAKVPMWASILVPVLMGFAIPFWGFILAPPLLAVIYAYKARGSA